MNNKINIYYIIKFNNFTCPLNFSLCLLVNVIILILNLIITHCL